MKHILIVGKGFSGLTSYLHAQGHEYIVLKDLVGAKSPDKKLKRRVLCDFSSRESVLATVDQITQPLDAVMTIYENYVLPTAWIAQHLGLPGMDIAAAEACTDKFIMRQLFAKAPEKISPDFALIRTEEDVMRFAQTHSFPLILKPANLAKSLLVTKNHSLEELRSNYSKAAQHIGQVYAQYAPHRTPTMLVEEFLEGSIHSVDAFVDASGEPHILKQIVDYQTGYDIGFEDNFHYSRLLPSGLSPSDQNALRHCAGLGVRALGMTSSPAHIEIIMTADGPRIVEIGARNGGYRERMHRLAHDIDILGNAVALALGQQVHITAQKEEPCAVLELLPKTPGTFVGIAHEEELRGLPSLVYTSVKAQPGTFVGKAADGYKMCAVIILHNANNKQFQRDLAFVNQNVRVITQ